MDTQNDTSQPNRYGMPQALLMASIVVLFILAVIAILSGNGLDTEEPLQKTVLIIATVTWVASTIATLIVCMRIIRPNSDTVENSDTKDQP